MAAAIDTQTLLTETQCYACYGATIPDLIELGLLRRTLLARNANADVSAAALITYAQCYACYGATVTELIELALLDQISQS